MTSSTETGDVTGTKDKDYNIIWFGCGSRGGTLIMRRG